MFALIDVGNTNTVVGLATAESPDLVAAFRYSTAKDRTADEWYSVIQPSIARSCPIPFTLDGMIVSSVVPSASTSFIELGQRHFEVEPLVVSSRLELGIDIEVDAPNEVGTDRLVNCAYAFAKLGGPTIVIDMGTATKIEAITGNGAFLGGVIAPGLGLSLETLAHRAARLYAVELKPAGTAIGRNTIAAVQSGVVNGHIALIDGLVARVAEELGAPRHVVLTGGFSAIVSDHLTCVTDYEPNLTLLGLRHIYLINRRPER